MTDYMLFLTIGGVVLLLGGGIYWMLRWHERKVDEAYKRGYDWGRRDTQRGLLYSELASYTIQTLRTETVRARIILEQWEIADMGEEEIVRLAARMLRSKVMEGIFPYMQIHHWTDPRECGEVVEARIRVVKDDG